ncbi:hypothetical protein K8R43_01130 [archaeon]|nr:hypothetical protein [archaeon]
MNVFWKSGKGFAFTLEAMVSLLACLVFVYMLSFHSQDELSDVIVYKQASDFLEVALKDGSLETGDTEHMKVLLSSLGIKASVYVNEKAILEQEFKPIARIERTLVTEEYERVVIVAGV